MKVLHVVYNSFPDETGGALRTRYVVETQARLGVRPVVLTAPFQPAADRAQHHGVECWGGIPYYRCYAGQDPARFMAAGKPGWERAAKLAALVPFAREIRRVAALERPDLIHAHSLFFCGLAAIAAGRSLGLPVIYEMRSLIGDGVDGAGTWLPRAYRRLDRWTCRLASHVTVISNGLRKELLQWGIPESKITVAGNGVDCEVHRPAGPGAGRQLRERLGIPPDAFVLGYLGTLLPYEGLDTLLDAAAVLARKHPRLRVLLVGDGSARAALEKQASRLGLSAHFVGRVPHQEVAAYYAAVDLFVLPRRPSRLTDLVTPLKPLEIMAYGRPLVAGDCGGHRELVIEGVNGFLAGATDPAALAGRLEALLADPAGLERVARQAREWVVRRRSWDVQCRPVLDIYQQLVRRPPARGGVLLVAPQPGPRPTGGVESGVGLLLRSPLAERYRLRVWDRQPPAGPRQKLPLRLARQAGEFVRFAAWVARRRPDVVHIKSSSGVNFVQSAVFAALSRALGRRTLLQLHSGEFEAWYGGRGTAGQWAIRNALRWASEILVLSEYWRGRIQPLAGDTAVHVVPNGVEIPANFAARRGSGGPLRVVTIAAVARLKGHFEILEAAHRLRDRPVQFLLAGPVTDDEIIRRAHALGLASTVTFLGPVGPREKWDLLAESDVFLLPSHAEGMPNAVLEAMAAGLPVIATSVGAIPEMLGEGSGGRLIPVGDAACLADALRELHAHPALRHTMREWNRARVAACYRMDRVLALLDDLYQGRPAPAKCAFAT
jgi:glycosyltransferase involved in cell wall biosynthesis